MQDQSHPANTLVVRGHDAAFQGIVDDFNGPRPPQALLLTGADGVGKATLGYAVVRMLLDHDGTQSATLAPIHDPENITHRKMLQQAHPDFLALDSNETAGKRPIIAIDQVRKVVSFFSKTSTDGSFRVALIDKADDMNVNAANSLLKILEEPPARGVLILVADHLGSLPATIASRCRRIRLDCPDPQTATAILNALVQANRLNADQALQEDALRWARGRPGLAARLIWADIATTLRLTDSILEAMPRADPGSVQMLAEGLGRPEADVALNMTLDRLRQHIEERIRIQPNLDEAKELADTYKQIGELSLRAERFNLDRAQLVLSSFNLYSQAMAASG